MRIGKTATTLALLLLGTAPLFAQVGPPPINPPGLTNPPQTSAPEIAFDAVPPENDDELITEQSVRAERDDEEWSQDDDLEALDAHSSLDV